MGREESRKSDLSSASPFLLHERNAWPTAVVTLLVQVHPSTKSSHIAQQIAYTNGEMSDVAACLVRHALGWQAVKPRQFIPSNAILRCVYNISCKAVSGTKDLESGGVCNARHAVTTVGPCSSL